MVIVFSTLLAFMEALREALGVLDPREEAKEGMDSELRLADLELWMLGVLGVDNLGEDQNRSLWSSVQLSLSLLSSEF